jgi:cytochrome d ubiquinol oxidase subunit I
MVRCLPVSLAAATTAQTMQATQEYLLQARQLQALSFAVHIPLVCFGVAFPALVVFAEWRARRTGDADLAVLARRWSKVMLALFAVGVVTGTILSFELGLLWPAFMARYGAVFGLAFTLEGISFFVEGIFIAIYVYGWERLSARMHLACGVIVAISGITGSLMVIAVNGWMNHPTGFTEINGEVRDIHPFQALFGNGFFWHELVHMYVAAYMVVGFCVAGVYAVTRLRGTADSYDRKALRIALTAAALASVVQVVVGDWAAREVAAGQPAKLAAFEGLGTTTRGAPVHVGGWYSDGKVEYGLALPRLLSVLSAHDPNATVTGLDAVAVDARPPVNVVRISFQTMVGIGSLLVALAVWCLVSLWRRGRPPSTPWFDRAVVVAGPLSIVALIAGWVTTEVGRQPWVVYGHLRTADAVTGADGIAVSYGVMIVVYLALAAVTTLILRRLARAPRERRPVARAGDAG